MENSNGWVDWVRVKELEYKTCTTISSLIQSINRFNIRDYVILFHTSYHILKVNYKDKNQFSKIICLNFTEHYPRNRLILSSMLKKMSHILSSMLLNNSLSPLISSHVANILIQLDHNFPRGCGEPCQSAVPPGPFIRSSLGPL
jgi:hypothetical protein